MTYTNDRWNGSILTPLELWFLGKLKPSGVDYLETWEAMEEFVNEGLVRAIGLSNFSLKQLQRVLDNCKIKPAVLQIETNAFWVDHSKEGGREREGERGRERERAKKQRTRIRKENEEKAPEPKKKMPTKGAKFFFFAKFVSQN